MLHQMSYNQITIVTPSIFDGPGISILPEVRQVSPYKTIKTTPHMPTIKDVIFNDPATIIFWEDGTKTVVKAIGEPYDKEKGMAMAIIKKICGNKGSYCEIFKKYIKEDTSNNPTSTPKRKPTTKKVLHS